MSFVVLIVLLIIVIFALAIFDDDDPFAGWAMSEAIESAAAALVTAIEHHN